MKEQQVLQAAQAAKAEAQAAKAEAQAMEAKAEMGAKMDAILAALRPPGNG